jgi:hypothetical protein
VPVDGTRERVLFVRNTGTGIIDGDATADEAEWSIASGGSYTLFGDGPAREIVIAFSPESDGEFEALVTLDGAGEVSIPVRGTAVFVSEAVFRPSCASQPASHRGGVAAADVMVLLATGLVLLMVRRTRLT